MKKEKYRNFYILVTAARNEATNLPLLIKSVVNQTITPSLWLIMNDNSIDNTLNIIAKASEIYKYIHFINVDPAPYDLAWHYHEIMSNGFNHAIEICKTKGINWDFIGVLDGDIHLKDNDYFEFLMLKINNGNHIGIASGGLMSFSGTEFIKENNDQDKPNGAARLITHECYNLIGYPVVPLADSIMRIFAQEQDFSTAIFDEKSAYQSRLTSEGQNEWNVGYYEAHTKYYLGYTLTYAFLHFMRLLSFCKIIRSFVFLAYYIRYFALNKEKTDNELILNYFKNVLKRNLKSL